MRKSLTTTTAFPVPPIPSAAETPRPAFCTIDTWISQSGMGRRSVYDYLGTGDLKAIKVGARTLIDVEHGLAWLRSRPAAVIRAPRQRRSPHPNTVNR
jgi:hypothetical protein